MKWSKYQDLATDPRLAHCLSWHVGRNQHTSALKPWVEKYLKYVAVRPWDTLDFNAVGSLGSYSGENLGLWIHYRIGNDDLRGSYLRESSDDSPSLSVRQQLDSIKNWHSTWWAEQPGDHPILIDAVVRQRQMWKSGEELDFESFDIYLPPDNFTL
jgi:hypothetical protein